jgi:hypothetical protein
MRPSGRLRLFAFVAAEAARISNKTKRADCFCERFQISRKQMRLNGRRISRLVYLDEDATKWAHTMMVFTLSCLRY